MAAQHLVRARGAAGAPVQHLDPQMQREALSRLLRDDWDAAFLISSRSSSRAPIRPKLPLSEALVSSVPANGQFAGEKQ
jgi:hypothetical protein